MAFFPGTQSFRDPFPRNRTQQGGDNRRARNAYGLPNLLARGFQVPGREAGNRTGGVPRGWSQGNAWWKQQGGTPRNKGQKDSEGGGAGGGGQERQRTGQHPFLNPTALPAWTWQGGGGGGKGHGGGGGPSAPGPLVMGQVPGGVRKGNVPGGTYQRQPGGSPPLLNPTGLPGTGGGRPGKGGPGVPNDIPRPPTNWEEVLAQIGLPLDPIFENARNLLRSNRDLAMTGYQNEYDTGTANANLQNVLAHRGIDEQMAARGLFGSGIENRSERLQNTSHTAGLMDLLRNLQMGTMQTQTGYNSGMGDAILQLAQRSMQDPYIPIPDWYSWMGGGAGG